MRAPSAVAEPSAPVSCKVAAQAESNGLDGVTSRGWNRIYVESRYACHAESGLFASATLKVWAPPFFASDNPKPVPRRRF